MKILAENMEAFMVTEELIAKINAPNFIKQFDQIENAGNDIFYFHQKAKVQRIEFPRTIELQTIYFKDYKVYDSDGAKTMYQVEISGLVREADEMVGKTVICKITGLENPNVFVEYK